MKHMSLRVIMTVFLTVLLITPGVPGLTEANTITLNYANFPPAPTFPCVQMERWKTEVEQRTNGQVKINTFPGETLLSAKDMMDGVIAGQSDIGCLCMAYQPGRFLVTNATGLPLNIPNARVGSLTLLDLYRKYQPEEFKQVKVLAMFTSAPSNIMTRKPVSTLEDIQGMNIRASGGAAELLKAWGANLVGMPMSDTPEALQKGVIQGVFSSLEVMKDFKYADICSFVTMTDKVIYPFAVVMNLDSWNELPPNVQQVMDELIEEQSEWTGVYMDNHVQEAIEWSKQTHQVQFIELSKEEKARWDERLNPIIEHWIKDVEQKGFPAQAIVNDIQAFIHKYSQ